MKKQIKASSMVCIILITTFIAVFNVNAISTYDETDFKISGPTRGYVGVSYDYTFYLAPNPYGENFSLLISWRIENNTGWMGPFPTGENITLSNSWDKMGFYTIHAFAKCNISLYYQTYEVAIFRSKGLESFICKKTINKPIFLLFLERFPLLKLMVQYLIKC
ncbi:hypothetical protein AYK20_07400 [Thermoplasmatales archaeon SG8-52-1]|nr:MAG: hypothetical protein AYK20_07400 [Thermoplasmatales archaeon SG8-52-1]